MSVAGTNFISKKFQDFCRHLDIHHALSSSMVFNSDENDHTALIKWQPSVNIDTVTHENIIFLPTRSTVAVKHNDGGTWTGGIVVRHRSDSHHERMYRIRV